MTPSSSLTGILQVAITVTEIDRATAFYRDALGLPVLMTAPNMAFFNCGGVRLYLSSGQGPEHTGGNSFLYFKTPDINAFLTGAKAKAITIHKGTQNDRAHAGPRSVGTCGSKIPEGNLLGVTGRATPVDSLQMLASAITVPQETCSFMMVLTDDTCRPSLSYSPPAKRPATCTPRASLPRSNNAPT